MYRDDPRAHVVIEREPVTRRGDDRTAPMAPLADDIVAAHTHWRGTLAGTLTALTGMLLLGVLGLAVGLSTFNAATNATQPLLPRGLGLDYGLWGALSMFIAFMGGGYLGSRMDDVRTREHGAWRGAAVFVMASPVLLLLILGGLLGAAAGMAGTLAGMHIDPALQTRANPAAMGDMASNLRDFTWAIFFGCVLGLAGSALGGILAAPRPVLRRRARAH
jgi:hypothetical protein